jgi:hypothetical protein
MDQILKSEIALRKLIITATEPLHLNRSTTRFIKTGSKCACTALGDL